MTVEHLREAESARRWRTLGFSEAGIKSGLSFEPTYSISESTLKRLERGLRQLEAIEEVASPARPERNTAARRSPSAKRGRARDRVKPRLDVDRALEQDHRPRDEVAPLER
jgi:hypothetical protein